MPEMLSSHAPGYGGTTTVLLLTSDDIPWTRQLPPGFIRTKEISTSLGSPAVYETGYSIIICRIKTMAGCHSALN